MKRKLDEEAGTLRNRIAKAGMKSKTPDERSNWLRARTREIGDWKRRLGVIDLTPQDVQALESLADECLQCAERKVQCADEADALHAEIASVMRIPRAGRASGSERRSRRHRNRDSANLPPLGSRRRRRACARSPDRRRPASGMRPAGSATGSAAAGCALRLAMSCAPLKQPQQAMTRDRPCNRRIDRSAAARPRANTTIRRAARRVTCA
ncbi:hypothetical protein [Burkholderia mayonis]|uniref:hypothetical protein n=1 Tax=Burkholderia mayonis TaxID=1385591 RepID=UPI000ADB145C|nr:hypothetical protein [Burkholderia mayonis]